MTDQRLKNAHDLLMFSAQALRDTMEDPDPVARRRRQVQIAKSLRRAADYLDDHGLLTE